MRTERSLKRLSSAKEELERELKNRLTRALEELKVALEGKESQDLEELEAEEEVKDFRELLGTLPRELEQGRRAKPPKALAGKGSSHTGSKGSE
jgi:hypothetical protein